MNDNIPGLIPTPSSLEIIDMPKKVITQSVLDYATKRLNDGLYLTEISKEVGFTADSLSVRLRRIGVDAARNHHSRPPHNRKQMGAGVVHEYLAGRSEKSIAQKLGVCRAVIRRTLLEAGVEPRNRSKAMLQRHRNMTAEERKQLASAAHEAVRGRAHPQSRQRDAARMREAGKFKVRIGPGENELANMLREKGLNVIRQKSVDVYNVDLAVGSIAVEITAAQGRLAKGKMQRRLKHIANLGYTIVYIQAKTGDNIIGNLEQLVSDLDVLCRNPPAPGKHWVVRCTSERFARTRNDKGQFSAVPSPVKYFCDWSELDPGGLR